MATRRLLSLTRRSHSPFTIPTRSTSSVTKHHPSSSPPSPPPPTFMIYDRLAESVKSKLKRLENPDPRFLRHASPHPVLTDHTQILNFPETRITTLPNGLRVATESNLASSTASVGVWVDSGSRYETDEINGVAHLLEHMMLDEGTQKVEDFGGVLHKCTSREQAEYYVRCSGKDVEKAIDVLADMLQNSNFEKKRIEEQRRLILSKMGEGEEQAEKLICDQLHATAYQYTPLGRTITGSAENIKKLTSEDIQDYISNHYATHRMVISAAGAVKHEDVVEQVKKLFTKLSSNPATTSQLVAEKPAYFTGSEIRMVDDDLPLARFAIAFSGATLTDPDSISLMVLQSMFGSWDKNSGGGKHRGSELVQRVAINELAESITPFNHNYKDAGLFGVYAVAKPDGLDDLAYVMMQAISRLCYRVSEDDVTRARNQVKSSLLLNIDGTAAKAEDIGRQLIKYGRRIPVAELFARIDAVDADTIKRVANRFIFDQDMAISAMGPIKLLPDYNWFRRRTYMLRY